MVESTELTRLLKWRCIGPFRGGRVVAVAGDPSDPATFYFGACAGGVWKTSDAGTYWENISDGTFGTAAVGALAVAESDPNVIYAGMGETAIRIDVSHGDGVYRSTDAGRSWRHMGLEETRFIGKIRIHPKDPELVYVAALGHAFGPNKERGVYRSRDGGENWENVLFRSDKAGAIDITLDAKNPRILYASIWEAYRSFWQISSGGPDSSIYRSMDGGDTWQEVRHNKGLPKGLLGKIALSASPAKSGRVWALIEAKEQPGLYRSDDYGDSWTLVSDKGELLGRPWYFTHITACTQNANTIYVNNYKLWKSVDGGVSFTEIGTPHGDNHDLWIDPRDKRRMIQGNDGGANVSFNGGESWSTIFNQPTAQFYHVATDNRYPYHVYGTQQDNSSIAVPSRGSRGAIPWAECYPAGSGESGYIVVDPKDDDIVYVGAIGSSAGGGNSLQRYNHRTKQIRLISVWPESFSGHGAAKEEYRFAWTYPILFSPHNPNVLYTAGNHVFRSENEGQSWARISPDLTRADPKTLKPSGGPINQDAIGAETYATIFAFVESIHEPGVFWAGSDDGLIHLSRDGGIVWKDVTPSQLPEWTMISMIEQSPHDPGTVYVAATRYKLDDYRPYLYRTTDYGENWQMIVKGISEMAFTRAIREDPGRRGLLYVGTETGLFVSFDSGDSWHLFQLNLPICPIHDLQIKENDLVAATHGRSFWILDDLTPLHQLTDDATSQAAFLFKPRDTVRTVPDMFAAWVGGAPGKNYALAFGENTFTEKKTAEGVVERKSLDAGDNPPDGVIVTYYLKEKPAAVIHLTFMDEEGNKIKQFSSKAEAADSKEEMKKPAEDETICAPAGAGMNRFIWDMCHESGEKVKGKDPAASKAQGPKVVPGTYQVSLTVGQETKTQSFDVIKDPRVEASTEDLQAQLELLIRIRDKISEANAAVNRMRDLRAQIDEWNTYLAERPGAEAIIEAGKALKKKLLDVEDPLIVPGLRTPSDLMNHGIRLIAKMSTLAPDVYSADFRPTDASVAVFNKLADQIGEQLQKFSNLQDKEVAAFNQLVKLEEVPALVVKSSL